MDIHDYLSDLSHRAATQFKWFCSELHREGHVDLAQQVTALKYSVFYSNPFSTLQPGRLYLMGMNPGGRERNRSDEPIQYEDETAERWKEMKSEYLKGWRDNGERMPLQERICKLIKAIQDSSGLPVGVEYIFAANLYFVRTPGQGLLDRLRNQFGHHLNCWSIHQEFLTKVSPLAIITFGNGKRFSTFSELSKLLGSYGETPVNSTIWSGRVGMKYRYIESPFWNRPRALLIGLPHLSWFWCGDNRVCQLADEISHLMSSLESI